MRTLVVRPQPERSATASIRIVLTMDAYSASGLRGRAALSSRKPRSLPATIRLDRAVWLDAKARRDSLAEPNVTASSFLRTDRCGKTGVLGPKKYPAPKPPSGPLLLGVCEPQRCSDSRRLCPSAG